MARTFKEILKDRNIFSEDDIKEINANVELELKEYRKNETEEKESK